MNQTRIKLLFLQVQFKFYLTIIMKKLKEHENGSNIIAYNDVNESECIQRQNSPTNWMILG